MTGRLRHEVLVGSEVDGAWGKVAHDAWEVGVGEVDGGLARPGDEPVGQPGVEEEPQLVGHAEGEGQGPHVLGANARLAALPPLVVP